MRNRHPTISLYTASKEQELVIQMKIGITVNLGNYESIRIDTNEYNTLNECLDHLIDITNALDIQVVTDMVMDTFDRVEYLEPDND